VTDSPVQVLQSTAPASRRCPAFGHAGFGYLVPYGGRRYCVRPNSILRLIPNLDFQKSRRTAQAGTSLSERKEVPMAICAHCKTEETELFESNVPICLACANARDARSKKDTPERAAAANADGHLDPIVPGDLKREG
jgi:hypothetical protein